MKKLKQFADDYYSRNSSIDLSFNKWVEDNPEIEIFQITAGESSDSHGHYRRTLYVLYEDKAGRISLNS